MRALGDLTRNPRNRALPWRWRLLWLSGNRTPPVYERDLAETIAAVRGYTMTTPAAIAALGDAVGYVARNGIAGALVECGVWRGGSMRAAAITLERLGHRDRDLYLFDTFRGPPPDTEQDVASPYAEMSPLRKALHRLWGPTARHPDVIDPAAVRAAVEETGYPAERVHLVEGPVEETLPDNAPERIALLRLDTDQYASTRHELTHLFPRLVEGGVLIVDDYGHYPGARRAVDEYFAEEATSILLHRVDYTARIGVKQGHAPPPG